MVNLSFIKVCPKQNDDSKRSKATLKRRMPQVCWCTTCIGGNLRTGSAKMTDDRKNLEKTFYENCSPATNTFLTLES